jgi:hypothetical protein
MESKYPPHPAASIFPMIKGKAYDEMREDIRAKGLLFPVVLAQHENQWCVLDGRNREKACIETGIKPRYDYYDGKDPIGYVVSANLARREMSTWERASAADELSKLAQGRPGKAAAAAGITRSVAAEMCGTSERSTAQAKHVKQAGAPELIEALDERKLSLSEADEIARLEKDQQADAIKQRKSQPPAERDPKISKSCSLSDEELDGLTQLYTYGAGSPSARVRAGAAALARIVPAAVKS